MTTPLRAKAEALADEYAAYALNKSCADAIHTALVEASPQWRGIESAPKMKTILLFAVTDNMDGKVKNWKMATGWFSDGMQVWNWDGHYVTGFDPKPTHWQPLPEPPALESSHE